MYYLYFTDFIANFVKKLANGIFYKENSTMVDR